jgi:MerR family transcriptional regulator/heat shock protein HspR
MSGSSRSKRSDREMAGKEVGYTIGAIARMHRVHPQTLRAWERQGLLNPSRSGGNTRLYTEQDLDTLAVILNLTRDLGVNLAGVEVILNMRRKMETMQQEVEEMIGFLRSQLGADLWDGRMEGLVKRPPSKPVRVRR